MRIRMSMENIILFTCTIPVAPKKKKTFSFFNSITINIYINKNINISIYTII